MNATKKPHRRCDTRAARVETGRTRHANHTTAGTAAARPRTRNAETWQNVLALLAGPAFVAAVWAVLWVSMKVFALLGGV